MYIFIYKDIYEMSKEKNILVRIDEELYLSIKLWAKKNSINLSQNIRNYLISEIKKDMKNE